VKLDGIALLAGPVENGSVKTVRIPDRCHLLDLEDDDGGGDEFQKTQCATTRRKSGRRNKVR
jgi:hypothetical protein